MSRHADIRDDEMKELLLNRIPPNTRRATRWATNAWNSWAHEKNTTRIPHPDNVRIPFLPVLGDFNAEMQSQWLGKFVCEVRMKNGAQYSKYSLEQLVHGIHRELRDKHPKMNILEDAEFNAFKKLLDGRLKQLTHQGVGMYHQRRVEYISEEQEAGLWDRKILNTTSAVGLMKAIFFYITKAFGLRSGMCNSLHCTYF